MRPRPIVLFERLFIATILLGFLRSRLEWDQTVILATTYFTRPTTVLVALEATTIALDLLLVLLISRRRNRVAMWTSVALFVVALPFELRQLAAARFTLTTAIAALVTIGQAVAYGLLLTPDARRWMRREP